LIRRGTLLGLFLVVISGAVWASSGVVINPQGERLEGVTVCYRIGNVDELCASTDEQGRWILPKSSIDRVVLRLQGYISQFIDGGAQSEPVILAPGATLLVKLEDVSGKSLSEGEIEVLYSSGRRIGPIPVSRAAGTRIRSLQPGPVVIVGRSAGFADGRASESELHAGRETVAVVKLKPVSD
jgi:hypothetical protein